MPHHTKSKRRVCTATNPPAPSRSLESPYAVFALILAAVPGLGGGTAAERVSVSRSGTEGNGDSYSRSRSVSADGRYVVFESDANNLVASDTNSTFDVFVHDRLMNCTYLVSQNSQAQDSGNGASRAASISADGHYVVFYSDANDLLLPGVDTNGVDDIFLRDLITGQTVRLSVDSNGAQGDLDSVTPRICPGGRYVAFESTATNLDPNFPNPVIGAHIYRHDLFTNMTSRVDVSSMGTQANGVAGDPDISDDGRYVSFWSNATNLHGSTTSHRRQVFVKDLQSGVVDLISIDRSGTMEGDVDAQFNAISTCGRYVAFWSSATNLIGPGNDQNKHVDVFVRDRNLNWTTLMSLRPDGEQGDDDSGNLDMSGDGRFVAFQSRATNLLGPGADTNMTWDIYVHDRDPDQDDAFDEPGFTISRASLTSIGSLTSLANTTSETNGPSFYPGISLSGAFVTYWSDANNIVPMGGDTNKAFDVFVHDSFTRMVPFCFGDDSGTSCPCQNTGDPGRGCHNSATTGGAGGGRLDGSGLPCMSSDTVRLDASFLPPFATALLFQGVGVVPTEFEPFGDGLRCVSGPIPSLLVHNCDAVGFVSFGRGVPGDPPISSFGRLPPTGGARYYQVWYRDAAQFCTSEAFNFSSGLIATWVP